MKAYEIQSFGFEGLKIVDRPAPAPGPGQILVRWKAFSLNYRDLLVMKGQYNPKMRLPVALLSDAAGVVEAVGPGCDRVKPGDRVASAFLQQWLSGDLTDAISRSALGGGGEGLLREASVLAEHGVVHFPAHLSFEEASTLPCAGLTAWHALVTEGQTKAGDTVLVQGTGGVSLFALQFARMSGARVVATSSSDAKLERVRQLGASDCINYKSTPEWGDAVRKLTGGQGVDHVVEVGGVGTLAQSMKAVKTGGRISLIGVLAGGGGNVNLYPALMRNLRLQGIFVGSRQMFEEMNRAISQHQLHPVVDRVFPFGDAAEAFRYLESGAHFGKIVVSA